MTNWRLRSCPRCGGDLFVENDVDRRWLEQCLQCAYHREANSLGELYQFSSEKKTKVAGGIPDKDLEPCLY